MIEISYFKINLEQLEFPLYSIKFKDEGTIIYL